MGNYTPNYDTKRYLINASLIVCGIMTLIQSYGVKHPKLPFQLGAGVLSVMGVSFTSLPIGQVIVPALRNDWYVENPQCTLALQTANCAITAICKVFPSDIASCKATCPAAAYHCQSDSFDYAWGMMVGTSCFCACVPFFISMLSFKRINQLFPPIVVGPTIMLIGIALINAGIGYWVRSPCAQSKLRATDRRSLVLACAARAQGGGVFCADNAVYGDASKYGMARTSYGAATSKLASLTFSNLNVTGLTLNATTGTYSGTIATPGGVVPGGAAAMTPNLPFKFSCGNTGDVKDVYGSAQFVGLGFLTFSTIMFIEVFGSPFLRNCSCVLGLLWGYAASAWSRHGHVQYVPLTIMNASPGITFLWTKKPFFKLGFCACRTPAARTPAARLRQGLCIIAAARIHSLPVRPLAHADPPLIIPLFIIYTITSLETWGDTAATIEASKLPTDGGPLQIRRQKGALLNDAVSGVFSGAFCDASARTG
jgi:xanthine/uracil permease